ncbi:MAG: hypothetical protein AB7U73_21145 [Pirellulales bacterium]
MKTLAEMVAHLSYRIGEIYYHGRPLMYGGTPSGVDLLLDTLHGLWAEAVERVDEYETTQRRVHDEENCDVASFSGRYQCEHPGASAEEVAQYAMNQWRKISDRLGVPIPHAALKQEFDEFKVDGTSE